VASAKDVGERGDRVAGSDHLGDRGRRTRRRLNHATRVDGDPADIDVACGRSACGLRSGAGLEGFQARVQSVELVRCVRARPQFGDLPIEQRGLQRGHLVSLLEH
jgi:hypothetical protein